jgi:hypothetical protein
MLAAAKYIGAGPFFLYSSIKEMVIRNSFSSLICATAFIIYFLYILLFGFNLFENDYFLLSTSSGLISPLENCSNKPQISRLTKKEQSEYTIPKDLEQILVGLLLGDLWADRRGDNTRFRFKQGICHKDYLIPPRPLRPGASGF